MWQEIRSTEEQAATATHFRVFPGEGAHSEGLADFVTRLDAIGYCGDYSFDVYNDDYLQMPPETVAARARRAAEWLGETVLRRALPVPNMERLRLPSPASANQRAAPAAAAPGRTLSLATRRARTKGWPWNTGGWARADSRSRRSASAR